MSDHPTTLTEAEREALEAACLEGLIETKYGYKYRPSKGADAVLTWLAARTPTATGDAEAEWDEGQAVSRLVADLTRRAATGDDLRDRVTAVLDEYAGSDHPEHLAIRALVDAAPAPVVSRPEATVKAEALREAANEVGPALANEVGGHTSTRSVRRYLRERAASLATDPEAGGDS